MRQCRTFKRGQAICDLTIMSDHLYIGSLRTMSDHQWQGHGTRLMKTLIRYSNIHKVRLVLFVGPFYNTPMGEQRLVKWYEKLGFKRMVDYDAPFATRQPWMEYVP